MRSVRKKNRVKQVYLWVLFAKHTTRKVKHLKRFAESSSEYQLVSVQIFRMLYWRKLAKTTGGGP